MNSLYKDVILYMTTFLDYKSKLNFFATCKEYHKYIEYIDEFEDVIDCSNLLFRPIDNLKFMVPKIKRGKNKIWKEKKFKVISKKHVKKIKNVKINICHYPLEKVKFRSLKRIEFYDIGEHLDRPIIDLRFKDCEEIIINPIESSDRCQISFYNKKKDTKLVVNNSGSCDIIGGYQCDYVKELELNSPDDIIIQTLRFNSGIFESCTNLEKIIINTYEDIQHDDDDEWFNYCYVDFMKKYYGYKRDEIIDRNEDCGPYEGEDSDDDDYPIVSTWIINGSDAKLKYTDEDGKIKRI